MPRGITQFGKKDEIYGKQTLFRELGYYILGLEQYEKSLSAFDEAIKHTPDDIRALIGRSRSRAKASQYGGALEDINKALKFDPDNLAVLAEKALDTYLNCEFEDGLVQNSRLVLKRQKPAHFTLGVMHCSNAIDTCIGEPAGRPLRDHFKIIRKLAWSNNRKVLEGYKEQKKRKKPKRNFFVDDGGEETIINHKKKSHIINKKTADMQSAIKDSLHSHMSEKSFVPPFPEEFPFRPLQNYTSNVDNFMASKYLESMYLDKNFLKKLENQPGTSCPNQKGSEKIRHLANMGYRMISYKQELLRTRRPFYHIKYKEGTSTVTLKTRQAQELFVQQQTTKKEVDFLFTKFQELFKQKKFKAMLNLSEKIRNYCDSKPKRLLPNKNKYLEKVFRTIRQGYYQLYRLNPNQYPWDQVKRIHIAFGLPISRDPSSDSVIEDTKPVFTDNKKQLQILEKRLKEEAESSEEICWCYHEMCRNNIELKQYVIARIYAKQCMQEAKLADSMEWMFITTMLLVRINIQQHNRNDARTELNNAREIAAELGNENLEKYLEKCSEVIESIDFEASTGPQVLVKRERKILALMNNIKLKDEFSHLFRMMSAMPASRRMTVIPGVNASNFTQKHTSSSKRKSIMPGDPSKADAGEESYQTKILKKKTETSKGVGFMNLIQYHIDEGDKLEHI